MIYNGRSLSGGQYLGNVSTFIYRGRKTSYALFNSYRRTYPGLFANLAEADLKTPQKG
jgi:hypothetical protein